MVHDNPRNRSINNWIVARELITIHFRCFLPLTETYKAPVIATKKIVFTKIARIQFADLYSHQRYIEHAQWNQIHTMGCCQNMSLANEHATAMTFILIVCNENLSVNLQFDHRISCAEITEKLMKNLRCPRKAFCTIQIDLTALPNI